MKIDWIRKLSSRKFWAAIIGVLIPLMALWQIPEMTVQQVVAVVTAVGSLVAFMLSEGVVDAAAVKTENKAPMVVNNVKPPDMTK